MDQPLQEIAHQNFDEAAHQYNDSAEIQKVFALKLANLCSQKHIKPGLWVDLGSGTGLLAESLESLHPNQSVLRLDNSQRMLNQHKNSSTKQIWDLNNGLPIWSTAPTLLASSFSLHWLIDPSNRLKDWFQSLEPGGWIALAIPIDGSFKEWHYAAKQAEVTCTALKLPSTKSLIEVIKTENIKYRKIDTYQQQASKVTSLLKPMIRVGAHASEHHSLNIKQWRQLASKWPSANRNGQLNLTWLIQLLLIQK